MPAAAQVPVCILEPMSGHLVEPKSSKFLSQKVLTTATFRIGFHCLEKKFSRIFLISRIYTSYTDDKKMELYKPWTIRLREFILQSVSPGLAEPERSSRCFISITFESDFQLVSGRNQGEEDGGKILNHIPW